MIIREVIIPGISFTAIVIIFLILLTSPSFSLTMKKQCEATPFSLDTTQYGNNFVRIFNLTSQNWIYSDKPGILISYDSKSIGNGQIYLILLNAQCMSIDEYTSYRINNLNTTLKDFQLIDKNSTILKNEYLANKIVYSGKPIIDNIIQNEIKNLEIFVVENDTAYTAIYTIEAIKFSNYLPVIEDILGINSEYDRKK